MAAEQPTAVVTGPAQWPKAAVLAACAAAGMSATSTAGDGELVLEVGGNSHEGLKAALAACAGAAPAGSDAQKVSEFIDLAAGVLNEDLSFHAAVGSHAALLRTLANMGVSGNATQLAVKKAFAPSAELTAALTTIEDALASTPFLAGDSASAADFAVGAALYEAVALLGPATFLGERPHTAAWLNGLACGALGAAFAQLDCSLGGWVREGGQVDKRPDPVKTGAAADASIALNAGYKKAANQRQKERASKKEAASAPPSAPVAAAASGGSAEGGNPHGVVATPEQRSANAEGVPTAPDGIGRVQTELEKWSVPITGPFSHAAADDVAKYVEVAAEFGGVPCKNLFVKAKKAKAEGDSRMWLVILRHDTNLNMKALATQLGYGKTVVRFGDAKTLLAELGSAKGHVSPFALMNDTALRVNVALDEAIVGAGAEETFLFHPFNNEASVGLKGAHLPTVVERTGHRWVTVQGE